MRCFVSFVCFLSAFVFVSSAPFVPGQFSGSLQLAPSGGGASGAAGGGLGGLTDILSQIDLPGLLRGINSVVKLVGVFCPPLSEVLDNVIQNVTSTAFRVFGRAILQGGGLGGSSNGGNGGGQKVSVVLPTFPPDEYDDEDEDNTTPTADKEAEPAPESGSDAASDESSNAIAKRHIRVVREAEAAAEETEDQEDTDQEGAESAPEPAEDLSNVEDGAVDDQDRDKRYTPDHGHAGSGNFLFDIIRLVAGSGAAEEVDEKEVGPGVVEVDVHHKGDHGEGIPGPITRLLVIANRGIANLVQDLILRLAQTSEKLVNFKARLITSLI